ncbi:hypothetical protein [Polyangium sp. 15x6]|uniref:hypothetical protein n=1 Tax=Polyangium sp. 15x6 TaxID=3042687 RepID=UPI00249C1D2A|nr:hypothetical protein [Polyangium sp. 15x6]MDI3291729.1 hypothetical protein [Polyangium sp. 15x6]
MRRRKALRPVTLALVTLALCALGCDKKNPSGASPDASASDGVAPLADFPNVKASSWINGAPAPLAEARGKVVLVEAWHPT